MIADGGFEGTVVRILTRVVLANTSGNRVRLFVAAGEPWDELGARGVTDGLRESSASRGIPGSTGATPVQNVGAYGQQVAETIISVRAYDREAAALIALTGMECDFAYRSSMFRRSARHVVLGVSFALERSSLGPLPRAGGRARGRTGGAPAAFRGTRGGARAAPPEGHGDRSARSRLAQRARSSSTRSSLPVRRARAPRDPAPRRRGPPARLARGGRTGQDVGRVADRARGLSPWLRRRPRRDLAKAHARQPRRREHRRAGRSHASCGTRFGRRSWSRCTPSRRWSASSCSCQDGSLASVAGPELHRVATDV